MKLTIGIPTFNRYDKLDNVLQQISNQLLDFLYIDNIEILISNNSSTDNTNSVIDKYKNIFACTYKYYIQDENIGFDRNVDFLFKKASGDFLWVLSDDDVLLANSVAEIYNSISCYPDIVFAFVNYNVNLNGNLIKSHLKEDKNVVINSDEVMIRINFANSLISSCIFNVSKWNEIDTKIFYNTCWIHMYVARSLLKEGESLIITTPLIEMQQQDFYESRNGKKRIVGIEFYFYAHLKMVEFCDSLLEFGYPKKIQKKAISFCKNGDLGHIINLKLIRGWYDIKEILLIIFYFFPYRKKNISYYLFFIPALLTPGVVYKSIRIFKNYFKNAY